MNPAPVDHSASAAVIVSDSPPASPPTPAANPNPAIRPHTGTSDQELQPLLRRRLIVYVCIGVWGLGSYVIGRALDVEAFWANEGLRFLFFLTLGILLVNSAALALLLASRKHPIFVLRGVELVALTSICLQSTANTLDPIPPFLYSPEATTYGANNDIFTWFIIITLYGVIIPNTLRRSIIMTCGMTGVAAAVMLYAWSRYDLTDSVRTMWLTNLVVFLGVAAGMTVFNSARLESYRRAAVAVRELGQYRLKQRLGGGGMGEVFLGEHRLLKRPCAIKLIRPEKAGEDMYIKRFAREVRASTLLTHPAAVQIYDYGQEADGTFYYVMEYLPGLTLDEVIRRGGPVSPGRAIYVLRQICGALAEAHSLGLIHRDVKPGNIMLCRLGGRADAAKLLDFGLVVEMSRTDTRLTNVDGVLGTPSYMSPEQARGASDLTAASDLYSLGAVAYFLITGRPPFIGTNALDLLHAHLTVPVDRPTVYNPAIPYDLEQVVLRMLAKSTAYRYDSAQAVDAALAACQSANDWSDQTALAWWEQRNVPEVQSPEGTLILTGGNSTSPPSPGDIVTSS